MWASLRVNQNKIKVKRRFIFSLFLFYLPIPRRTIDASAKTVSMVSGFCGAPNRLMLQTWQDSVEDASHSAGSVSGRKRNKGREKESGRGAGRQGRGLQNGTTTENLLSPGLYPTTPSPRPGPAPSSYLQPPLSTHSNKHTNVLPSLSISLTETN